MTRSTVQPQGLRLVRLCSFDIYTAGTVVRACILALVLVCVYYAQVALSCAVGRFGRFDFLPGKQLALAMYITGSGPHGLSCPCHTAGRCCVCFVLFVSATNHEPNCAFGGLHTRQVAALPTNMLQLVCLSHLPMQHSSFCAASHASIADCPWCILTTMRVQKLGSCPGHGRIARVHKVVCNVRKGGEWGGSK